jgi:hypothetical protein
VSSYCIILSLFYKSIVTIKGQGYVWFINPGVDLIQNNDSVVPTVLQMPCFWDEGTWGAPFGFQNLLQIYMPIIAIVPL